MCDPVHWYIGRVIVEDDGRFGRKLKEIEGKKTDCVLF